MARLERLFYALIPVVIILHIFVSPYTKVEESFNIQAIHDILTHGIPTKHIDYFLTANYDHVSFPGSVPRTFVGALILSGLSWPWVGLANSLAQVQVLVRVILGLLNASALIAFARSVQRTFGSTAGIWFALFQASQFHVVYYASRTLPNFFAFFFSTLALRSLLDAYAVPWSSAVASRRYRISLGLLTFAGVTFRSELSILVGTLSLYLYVTRQVSIASIIVPAGLTGAVLGLLCTVPIDSFFWQSFPLWPEWTAFYFNTIQGHSTDWGVSPWHHYFAQAVPRLLFNPATYLLCIPLAVLNSAIRRRSLGLLIPITGFIGLYSILPHKEWRFIIYTIPALTATAAAGASWIWTRRAKSLVYAVLSLALAGSVILSFAASSLWLTISSFNYPGAEALNYLHYHVEHPLYGTKHDQSLHNNTISVYIDNLAAQTGVTRFLENHDGVETLTDPLSTQVTTTHRRWNYDKTEDPARLLDPLFWTQFDYVLAERPEKIIGNWQTLYAVYGFHGLRIYEPGDLTGVSGDAVIPPRGGAVGAEHWTVTSGKWWKWLEGVLRKRMFKGWWMEVLMAPRIKVLKNVGTRDAAGV